jgi:hypothetical protein
VIPAAPNVLESLATVEAEFETREGWRADVRVGDFIGVIWPQRPRAHRSDRLPPTAECWTVTEVTNTHIVCGVDRWRIDDGENEGGRQLKPTLVEWSSMNYFINGLRAAHNERMIGWRAVADQLGPEHVAHVTAKEAAMIGTILRVADNRVKAERRRRS